MTQLSQYFKVSNGGPLNRNFPVKINMFRIQALNLGHLVFSSHRFEIERKSIEFLVIVAVQGDTGDTLIYVRITTNLILHVWFKWYSAKIGLVRGKK